MTRPDDDIEQRLRAALGNHADDAPRVNLADAALSQAGRIRTRRRVGAGLVAAAVVALAVPIATTVTGDGRQDNTATKPTGTDVTGGTSSSTTEVVDLKPVRVALTGLDQGSAPEVPYIAGDQFVSSAGTTTLAGTPSPVTDAVQLADGVGVWSQKTDLSGKDELSTNGAGTDLPTGEAVSNPAVDAETGEIAYAALGGKGESDTVVVAKALNGDSRSASTGGVQVAHVMGVHDGVVVFNGLDDSGKVVALMDLNDASPTVETPWASLNAKTISAIDPKLDQFAAFVGDRAGQFGERDCSTMFTAEGDEEWDSCAWRPVEFSPDGSAVLAVATNTDGFGVRQLAVLDADTGALLAAYTTPGTFGRATFEDDQVMMVTVTDDQSAIVRCDIEGPCELATSAQNVVADDPESLVTPYQLTAN